MYIPKLKRLTITIPENIYKDLIITIPDGMRSEFISNIIQEKINGIKMMNKLSKVEIAKKIQEEFRKNSKKINYFKFINKGRL